MTQTIWLTGLSGSGKTTLSRALAQRLVAEGYRCTVLDGDDLRQGLCKDLGFSEADRSENIRRVAEVARILNDAKVIALVALISPYAADRALAKRIIGPANMLEVFVSTPLEICERRDPKGLYQRARRGDIALFTGVSAPYERPTHPTLAIDTGALSLEACLDQITTTMALQ
jgi:adenylylsulfate kinase